jgi:hypothetical protein
MSLPVFLTVDVGPDDAVLGHEHERHAQWSRTTDGLADLQDVFGRLAKHAGTRVDATWFVRADRHIAAAEGRVLAVFDRFDDFLRERQAAGDAIGWMPQAYSGRGGHIDYTDLASTHAALRDHGWSPGCVRMGGCFHDNRSMGLLDEFGIDVDCSAIPGRQKFDGGWQLDWLDTPQSAYRPSLADYRRPGRPDLRILELPLSVLAIKAPYDEAPLFRYINPAMRPPLLFPQLEQRMLTAQYLHCVVHADELRPPAQGHGHPLIAYSPATCLENLCRMVDCAIDVGRQPVFATVLRARELLCGSDADAGFSKANAS